MGGTIGFAWGFAGSALSQRMSGRRVDWRRAAGAGINGAVIGAVRGAMTASGVGAAAAFAGNFAAGTAGSALEQWIGTGNVSARRSVAGGLINASSSLWYGNKGFKNAGQALSRGFGAGATRSGIEYLAETLGRPSRTEERNSLRNRYERGYGSSASGSRDPRRGCGSTRPRKSTLGYTSASGYRYRTLESGKSRRNSFSLSGLLKTMAFGGVMEGLGNLAFFEAGRAVEALKRSVLSTNSTTDTRNVGGRRTDRHRELTDDEISQLLNDIDALEADPSIFRFNEGNQTGFLDSKGIINVRGDVLPDLKSNHPRDLMSSRAVLAHEYYGHKHFNDVYGTRNPLPGSWNDEFRASYNAAINAPNLSDIDRAYLMSDALERAREAGVIIKITDEIRRIMYGY